MLASLLLYCLAPSLKLTEAFLKYSAATQISIRYQSYNNQVEDAMQNIFAERPVNEVELNSYLDRHQRSMNSKSIVKLLRKLGQENIILSNNRLNSILQILLDRPDVLSGENIYSLVQYSKEIQNPSIRMEIWNVILKKV